MHHIGFGAVVALTVLTASSGSAADLPTAPEPRPAGLSTAPRPRPAGFTAEKAKQALLGLMATRDKAPVCRADIKTFGEAVAEVGEDDLGVAYWGPFTLNLADMSYRFRVGGGKPGGPGGFWFMAYEGTFEQQGGKWVALPFKMMEHGRGW